MWSPWELNPRLSAPCLYVSRANCYSMEPKTELSLGGIQTRMYELNCFTCFYTFCNVFQTSCKAKAFSLLAFLYFQQ